MWDTLGLPIPLRRIRKHFSQSACTEFAPCEVDVKTEIDVLALQYHTRTVVSSAGSSITHGWVSVRSEWREPTSHRVCQEQRNAHAPRLQALLGAGAPSLDLSFLKINLTFKPEFSVSDDRRITRSRHLVIVTPHRCAVSVPLGMGRTQLGRAHQ